MMDEKRFLGLTKSEYDNLIQAIRYGVIIVITVLITFIIVAGLSGLFGYVPPQPGNYEETIPTTSIGE